MLNIWLNKTKTQALNQRFYNRIGEDNLYKTININLGSYMNGN